MKIVAGNWKMHLSTRESVALARGVMLAVRGKTTVPQIILCPSFTALSEVHKVMVRSRVMMGAQDLFWETAGAYTGEISSRQLKDVGCSYVIVGHSERRHQLGETDEMVAKKTAAAIAAGLTPIVCVGETTSERQEAEQQTVVKRQVKAALAGLHLTSKEMILFAYEPVWAIGSGHPASPTDAVEMHALIRKTAMDAGLKQKQIAVLYGGSVEKSNAYSFLREPEVDGVLVGGASIKLGEFEQIVKAAADVQA